VDLPGFENFVENSLDQLFINYQDEKIQGFFQHAAVVEMELYTRERLEVSKLEISDRAACIELLEVCCVCICEKRKQRKTSEFTFFVLFVFCLCFVCVLFVFCLCFVCVLFVFCLCFVCVCSFSSPSRSAHEAFSVCWRMK